jgi:hypothetical protein
MSAKFLGPFVSFEGLDPADTSNQIVYRVYLNVSGTMEVHQSSENSDGVELIKLRKVGGTNSGGGFEFYPVGEGDSLEDSDYGFTKWLNRNLSNVATSSPEQVIIEPEYPESLAAVSQQAYCYPF